MLPLAISNGRSFSPFPHFHLFKSYLRHAKFNLDFYSMCSSKNNTFEGKMYLFICLLIEDNVDFWPHYRHKDLPGPTKTRSRFSHAILQSDKSSFKMTKWILSRYYPRTVSNVSLARPWKLFSILSYSSAPLIDNTFVKICRNVHWLYKVN